MNRTQYNNLLRFLSEETAHHKFGEMAVEFNTSTGEFQFTDEAERFIRLEIEVMKTTFECYDCKPKLSLIQKIKQWLKK